MKVVKPGKFQLYRPLMDTCYKMLSKQVGKKQVKTPLDAVKVMINASKAFVTSIDYLVILEEARWVRQGKDVLFPSSRVFVDHLLRAKYKLDSLESLEMPFSSFVLSMPDGYEINGVRVRSMLVSTQTYNQGNELLHKPLIKELGMSNLDDLELVGSNHEHDGQKMIVICSNCDDGNVQRIMVSFSDLAKILNANVPSAVVEFAGFSDGKYTNSGPQTDQEIEEQFYALKIISGLAIYNQATEGRHIRKGLPGNANEKFVLAGQGNTKGQNHLTLGESLEYQGGVQSVTTRTWFFRQLRDEKYYRGEHKAKAPGSRWTFVRETILGGGDPSTIDGGGE
jgi:hypothetical protein